jgi:hypothetical protein
MSADTTAPNLPVSHDLTGDTFPIYTSTVKLSGGSASHGRASWKAVSDDGELSAEPRVPTEMGVLAEARNAAPGLGPVCGRSVGRGGAEMLRCWAACRVEDSEHG